MTHPEMKCRRAPRRAGQDHGILDPERIKACISGVASSGISDPR
jgi:hypothetical protein